MLGVRGAAWVGGITLVITALLLAKLGYEHGVFTPILRVTAMILAGTAALIWAEIGLRKGYRPSADAISGAGLVSLYAGWYSAHVNHRLIESPLLTFVAMSVTTLVAAGISARHGAAFTAALGLLGGLATPPLLSQNSNNPLGLFLYLAVLNVGFLWVARKRAWTFITAIALAGTSLMEFGWMATRLNPETLPVAVIGFAVLGAIYMWHAVLTGDDEAMATSHVLGFLGGMLPLGLAVVLAADPRFVELWPWVLGNLVILGLAAITIGVMRLRLLVLLSAAVTALACVAWSPHLGTVTSPVGPAMVVLLLTAMYNVLGRLWPDSPDSGRRRPMLSLLGMAGLIVAAGLVFFSLALLIQTTTPAGLVIGIVALLFLVGVERSSVDVGPLVLPATAGATGVLAQVWFERTALPGQYVGVLAFAHLLAIAYAVVAFVRDRLGVDDDAPWVLRADLAVLVATVVAYVGLHGALARSEFAAPAPLFALLGLDIALVLLVAIRRGWTSLVPLAALAACLFAFAWHALHFTLDTGTIAVGAEIAIYLLFVALPFILTAAQPAVWRRAAGGWLTSALIGPMLFVLFRAAWVEYWGTGAIGLLPVILAAGSVMSLAGVSRIFSADEAAGDPEAAARRLNYMALFAAIALGFVAAAISVQFEKQWLTIGLALEAAAVFWLFGLVPHPGLKYFGLILFGAVGARLIVNPEVLRYEPRGAPIVNWLLYSYGVPVLCHVRRRLAAAARRSAPGRRSGVRLDRRRSHADRAGRGGPRPDPAVRADQRRDRRLLLAGRVSAVRLDAPARARPGLLDRLGPLQPDAARPRHLARHQGAPPGRAGVSDADGRQGVPVRSVGVEGDLPGAVVLRAGHRADRGVPALPALRRQETAMTLLRPRPLALVAVFIAACVAVTAQVPDSQDAARAAWRYRRPVVLADGARADGFMAVTIPPEVAERSQPGLADLRLVSDEGREVPYVLDIDVPRTAERRRSGRLVEATDRAAPDRRRGWSTSTPPPPSIASSSTSTAPTSASASMSRRRSTAPGGRASTATRGSSIGRGAGGGSTTPRSSRRRRSPRATCG